MWTVKQLIIFTDLANYSLLPKKLESVQPSSMADQVTWSPIMSSLFAIFPVDWIGHHLRPCCCHHYHGNHHCHHWRLLMRNVKTLLLNILISKCLNLGDISTKLQQNIWQQNIPIKLNVSIIYLNNFATDLFLTHAEHSESTSLQVFNLTFACILINIFCICLLFVYLSHFHCVFDVFALFSKRYLDAGVNDPLFVFKHLQPARK